MPAEDLTGQRFNQLTAIIRDGSYNRHVRWLCKCDCGNTKSVPAHQLKSGHTKSCGCYRSATLSANNIARGKTILETEAQREYDSWRGAWQRCFNENNPKYPHYGARGITMCAEWKDDFPQFYLDMGPRPEGKTLDRIDNDGPYAPWNCRWATASEQMNNRRRLMKVTDLVEAGLVTWEQVNQLRDRLESEGR